MVRIRIPSLGSVLLLFSCYGLIELSIFSKISEIPSNLIVFTMITMIDLYSTIINVNLKFVLTSRNLVLLILPANLHLFWPGTITFFILLDQVISFVVSHRGFTNCLLFNIVVMFLVTVSTLPSSCICLGSRTLTIVPGNLFAPTISLCLKFREAHLSYPKICPAFFHFIWPMAHCICIFTWHNHPS